MGIILIFLNLEGKQKFVRKIGEFEKSRVKITVFDWGEENDFRFELSGVQKNEGLRNRDSTVLLKQQDFFSVNWKF